MGESARVSNLTIIVFENCPRMKGGVVIEVEVVLLCCVAYAQDRGNVQNEVEGL